MLCWRQQLSHWHLSEWSISLWDSQPFSSHPWQSYGTGLPWWLLITSALFTLMPEQNSRAINLQGQIKNLDMLTNLKDIMLHIDISNPPTKPIKSFVCYAPHLYSILPQRSSRQHAWGLSFCPYHNPARQVRLTVCATGINELNSILLQALHFQFTPGLS